MFGVSMWEMLLILVVALIVLGPRQLTETAKIVGKLYRELQKMTSDLRSSVDFDLSSPSNSYNRPPTYQPPQPQPVAMPEPSEKGKKTGPDFYAELLERSEEEDKKEQAAPSQNPASESGKEVAEKSGDSKEKAKA